MLVLLFKLAFVCVTVNLVASQDFNSSLDNSQTVVNVTEDATRIETESEPNPPAEVSPPGHPAIPENEQEQADQPAASAETVIPMEPTRLPPKDSEVSTHPTLVHHSSTSETPPSPTAEPEKPTTTTKSPTEPKKPDVPKPGTTTTSATTPGAKEGDKKGGAAFVMENFALILSACVIFRFVN